MHSTTKNVPYESSTPATFRFKLVVLYVFLFVAVWFLHITSNTVSKMQLSLAERPPFRCTDNCYRNKTVCLTNVKNYGNSQQTRFWYHNCSAYYVKLCIDVYHNCLHLCNFVRRYSPPTPRELSVYFDKHWMASSGLHRPKRFRKSPNILVVPEKSDHSKKWSVDFASCKQLRSFKKTVFNK